MCYFPIAVTNFCRPRETWVPCGECASARAHHSCHQPRSAKRWADGLLTLICTWRKNALRCITCNYDYREIWGNAWSTSGRVNLSKFPAQIRAGYLRMHSPGCHRHSPGRSLKRLNTLTDRAQNGHILKTQKTKTFFGQLSYHYRRDHLI